MPRRRCRPGGQGGGLGVGQDRCAGGGEAAGSKLAKAQELGITIWTEAELQAAIQP
jgi:hypothetical protein